MRQRLLLVLACLLVLGDKANAASPKVIVLGIDGMDPKLLERFVGEGYLPNFKKLMEEGDFKPLQTTMPPLSPVAWSTFITGTDAGGHEIFDFIHRDPSTLMPESSMSKAIPAEKTLSLGSWVLPLSSGRVEQLRKGQPFWELLEDAGIKTTIFRMPANFPPAPKGRSFSGMGTPDLLGTPGTFTLFTADPPENAADITGGRVVQVTVQENVIHTSLEGPQNTFRRLRDSEERYKNPPSSVDLEIFIDPDRPLAKIVVQDQELVLKEGEWSEWIRVDFELIPFMASASSVARFYLKQVRPNLQLYVTPLQINPEEPAMPITNPEDWAGELHRELGYFYTQEIPEDSKALSAGVFTPDEFWEQAQSVYRERRKALDYFLNTFQEGLLFFYFSSVDQGSHSLWRHFDENHPGYLEHPTLRHGILTLYRQMDEALEAVLSKVDANTTLIVMSDHGFAPFYWGFNLNSWLLEKGYVTLKDPSARGKFPVFLNVDWDHTQAYAVGLNGLYINLQGREKFGAVTPLTYSDVVGRLKKELIEIRDPQNGQQVVSLVLEPKTDFRGSSLEGGPDLIVGYNWGYRSSWKNPLGEFPEELFEENIDAWSGDHSMDYRLVPGVLLSNRKISIENPALYDLTVAVLDEFGLSKSAAMIGEDCLAPQ